MTADILALARWWGVFFLLGLAALPYALALFGGLRDKGWAFSKVLGLAFCSWLSFAGATGQSFRLLPFRVWSCWLWLGLFAFCGWVCLLAGPDPQRPHGIKCRLWAWGQKVRAALKDKAFLRRAGAEELAFFLALALWSYLRATNPELRDLEKFMDHGFVAAILNSTWMPAQDMWYAGEGINYYYYGHFATAYLCRLAGVGSAVGYNLMMATTFALTLSLSAALGYCLMGLFCAERPAPFGKKREELLCTGGAVFSALLVAVGGNGHAFVHGLVLPFLNKLGLVDYTAEYWYPDATRYINCYEGSTDATIHEFPFYSFIVSDLHAHVLDICFVLLFLALSLVWLGHARQNARAGGSLPAGVLCPAFFLCGFLLGLMAMTNFWDFAIYTIVSLFFAAWAAGLRRSPLQAGFWGELAARMAILVACKTIFAFPFEKYFSPMATQIGLVKQSSPLPQFLVLWFLPLACFAGYAAVLIREERRRLKSALKDDLVWEEAAEAQPGEITFVAGAAKPRRLRPRRAPRREEFSLWLDSFGLTELFVLCLFLCGTGLIVGPELLYLKDIYDTAPRANTMFKLTYQAFILFGLAVGYCLARFGLGILANTSAGAARRAAAGAVGTLCLFIPLCYTPLALDATYLGRHYEGLDGLAFIQREAPNEARLIDWLNENAAPDAVVAEAAGFSYTQNCRVSMATGRPTIVGWHTHEWLWRDDYPAVEARFEDVKDLYESGDAALVQYLLEKYGVSYLVLGPREREFYPDLEETPLRLLSSEQLDFGEYLLLVY